MGFLRTDANGKSQESFQVPRNENPRQEHGQKLRRHGSSCAFPIASQIGSRLHVVLHEALHNLASLKCHALYKFSDEETET